MDVRIRHDQVRVLGTRIDRGPARSSAIPRLAVRTRQGADRAARRRHRRRVLRHRQVPVAPAAAPAGGGARTGPRGAFTAPDFFDTDKPRSPPPQRRPEASRLLAALADPSRGFSAVVVGEPQRAFYGNQFGNTFSVFAHYGVPLWVPEVGGPIDPDNEAHDLIMSVFGGVSKVERNRIKIRVR